MNFSICLTLCAIIVIVNSANVENFNETSSTSSSTEVNLNLIENRQSLESGFNQSDKANESVNLSSSNVSEFNVKTIVDVFGKRFITLLKEIERNSTKTLSDDELIRNSYVNYGNELNYLFKDIIDEFIDSSPRIFQNLNLSEICSNSLLHFARQFQQQKDWSIKFINAFGKISNGFLFGMDSDLGNFDQCIQITVKDKSMINYQQFNGKYCLLTAKPKLTNQSMDFTNTSISGTVIESYVKRMKKMAKPVIHRYGICVPSTCTDDEVELTTKYVLDKLHIPVYDVHLASRCTIYEGSGDKDYLHYLTIVAITLVLLISIIGTMINFLNNERTLRNPNESIFIAIFLSFAANINIRKFFQVKSKKDFHHGIVHLPILDAIRFLSIAWLVLVNTFVATEVYRVLWLYRNAEALAKKFENTSFLLITNSWIFVDTFILINGLLLSYKLLKILQSKSDGNNNADENTASTENSKKDLYKANFDYLNIIVKRWLQLSFTIMGAICLYNIALNYADGPIMEIERNFYLKSCRNYFLLNFLFINNWFNIANICLFTSWPLSVLMQLTFIGPPLVYVLHKKPVFTVRLAVLLTVLSMLAASIIAFVQDVGAVITPNVLLDDRALEKFGQVMLLPTYLHIPAYFIGILTGYYLNNSERNEKSKMKNILLYTLWSAIALLVFIELIQPTLWLERKDLTPTLTFLHTFILRAFWSLFISLLIIILLNLNDLNSVKILLTWHGFNILNKLTLSLSLIHLLPTQYHLLTVRQTKYWNHFELISSGIANIVIGIALAFTINILFESPIKNLIKFINKKRKLRKEIEKQTAIKPYFEDIEC